jgi:hypothetical protein
VLALLKVQVQVQVSFLSVLFSYLFFIMDAAVIALRQELSQAFNATIQALRAESEATIQALRNEIATQASEIATLRTRPEPRPKPILPDPEKFTGQAYKFDTWLPSIKAKLRVDHAALGDSIAQFYYVYLNLESTVQAMVLPQLAQAEDLGVWDYNTILDQLSRVYDNPNKVQEAEDRLLAIKQGPDEPVATYIAKFERVLYEAKGQDWPDVNKISTFRKGLNSTIRSRLAQQLNLPRAYSQFLRVVQQLSSHSFSSSSREPPTNRTNHHNQQDTMDLTTIQLNALERGPSPPRARSLSPAQRERFRLEGRCVRCGSYDHWVDDCSLRPHSPKPIKRQMAKRIPAEDEDDQWSGSDWISDNYD